MSQTAIGRAALLLGLDASELKKGFHSIKGFVKANMADLAGVAKTTGELLSKGVTVGLAGIGVAGAAGMGGFIAATKVAQDRIEELRKVATGANAFGLDTFSGTGLYGLAGSAGSDVKDFTESLATMSQRASETGEVAASMFKGLNIEASEFAKLRTDEQWYKVMGAISAVQNPAERVRLAFLAFGEDGGKTILSLVGKTEPELRKMAAGFAVTAGEMARMNAASSALSNLDSTFGRLKNKLAVAASPFIQAVAESLNRLDVEGLGRRFEKVYSIATDLFKRVSDYASDQFNKLGTDLEGWLNKSVAPMVKPGTDPKGNPAVSEFARAVAEFGKSVGQFSGNTFDRVNAGLASIGGARDWLLSKGASIGTSVGIFDENWGNSLRVGFKKSAQQLFKESNDAITANTGDKWAKVGERLGLQAGTAAAQVIDKALTPYSRAAQVAVDMGLAAIEGAESAMRTVEDNLPTGKGGGSTENTAYRAGTAEELSYRLRMMNSATPEVQKQQLSEAKKQTAIQQRFADDLKRWAEIVSFKSPVAN